MNVFACFPFPMRWTSHVVVNLICAFQLTAKKTHIKEYAECEFKRLPILITRQYIIPSHAPKVKFNQVYFVGRTEFRVYCCQSVSQSAGWTCIMRVLVQKKKCFVLYSFVYWSIDIINQDDAKTIADHCRYHMLFFELKMLLKLSGVECEIQMDWIKKADGMLLMHTQSATFTCFTWLIQLSFIV